MAELVKYGFISDRHILSAVLADPEGSINPEGETLPELIRRAVEIKEQVVASDFEESGLRRILNYGHTLGHAIEHVERYQWRHGAAISIGMIFAAELSATLGRLSTQGVELHYQVLESLRLPVSYRPSKWKELYSAMQLDKKGEGGILKFVVLDDIERPTVITAPEEQILFATYQTLVE
jgi:3-dehydroquinate synthase